MNKIQHISHNAALESVELIDTISSNIVGYGKDGHRAKRWSFSDYTYGGNMTEQGYSMRQGKQEPRIGEWTKMMIRGRGMFTVEDPRSRQMLYTRLGDFHIDAEGNMVTKEGFQVQATPLAGAFTKLRGHDPSDPDFYPSELDFYNPFENPRTNNAQNINAPGGVVGGMQGINLRIDPVNGKYLGLYDKIKVGDDGVVYGQDGRNLVSLYKLSVVNFNNPEGLNNVKDGIYFKSSYESGAPSLGAEDSTIISEALEKSNSWIKLEAHYLTDAQRYYQAATQIHKLADKITGTAIEMIQ